MKKSEKDNVGPATHGFVKKMVEKQPGLWINHDFLNQLGNSRPVFQSRNPRIWDARSQDFWIENVAGILWFGTAIPTGNLMVGDDTSMRQPLQVYNMQYEDVQKCLW